MKYKIKSKKSRRKSLSKVEKNSIDDIDIKLELHEDNGLNEDSEESERDSKCTEEVSPVEKSPQKSEQSKSHKKQSALNGTAHKDATLCDIDEFIANGPRKPEK